MWIKWVMWLAPIAALIDLFFFFFPNVIRIRKPSIYSPKQVRKVIKPATKGEIGFIICPSYTRKSKLNKELKGAAIN
jgi:hypothetical protein